jgi:hypothetical protein
MGEVIDDHLRFRTSEISEKIRNADIFKISTKTKADSSYCLIYTKI